MPQLSARNRLNSFSACTGPLCWPAAPANPLLLAANPLADIANVKKIEAVVARGQVYGAPALAGLLRAIKNR